MDATWIITVFVVIDEVMERLEHRSHVLAEVPDAEILTIAVVAAKYFHNHHERAVCLMRDLGYLSGRISVSRFNRRLHALTDWLSFIATTLGEICTEGDVYVIDSLPVPVCRRARAPLSQSPRAHLLWVLCRQEGKILRVAAPSGRYPSGRAGEFHDPARRVA